MTAIITSRMACLMVITRFRRTASRITEATKHEGRYAPFYMNMPNEARRAVLFLNRFRKTCRRAQTCGMLFSEQTKNGKGR
ncbi:hypothetical protein M493_12047 [Geobacillus genomosp. 3]|uniref:Uncharacterized protein n=1 Tax=Geobacillus genomosp. 3 TaxID=1921421 RepID=V5LX22_GEOG3|nr:hypothetical protein M493_12047 [Geobacillus genomosp. 3]